MCLDPIWGIVDRKLIRIVGMVQFWDILMYENL